MFNQQQDQEDQVFGNIYDIDSFDNFDGVDDFDYHSDDGWLNYSEHNLTPQPYQDDQKVESGCSVSSSVDNQEMFSLKVANSPNENSQIQVVAFDQTKNTKKTKKPKTKVILSQSAEQFKKKLYKLLSNGEKKIVRKQYVFTYHSLICEKNKIRDVQREEYRSIGNYFNAFASKQDVILRAIRELKENEMQEFNYNFRISASITQS